MPCALFLLVLPVVSALETCGDLRDAYRSNQCCGNPSKPLTGPGLKPFGQELAENPTAMAQLVHMANPSGTPSSAFFKALLGVAPIGAHTAHICEATDAAYSDVEVMDGHSGDTDYPYGQIKVLATVGEMDKTTGYMLVGVPDGMGSYLLDETTVRIVFQSESYGPFGGAPIDSYPFMVNNGAAGFTGSHVMYIDYDRSKLADFMTHDKSAEGMVKGAGELITRAYNLKGDMVEARNASGCTAHPHFSNTDPHGCNNGWDAINNVPVPQQADWVMQSLCAAHLEEKHQWGEGLGVEDSMFITNEEWTTFVTGSNYTGLPAHAIDLATGSAYATGVFTLGGFEKIVEVNCGAEGYVCFSPSGYNGAFGVDKAAEATRKNSQTRRPDGTDYVFPQNVVPARLYIGKKGVNAKGEAANDFLSRNGLAYGQLYGFSTDVSSTTGGLYMDEFSKVSAAGTQVAGAFHPLDWQWDGEVKPFMSDGSWAFQHLTSDGLTFWYACGRDCDGAKMEHNSPDPYGGNRFVQGSTAGWMGIFDFTGVADLIATAHGSNSFPSKIPANFILLQGEQDITSQIHLGGKGRKANGEYQTHMSDSYSVGGADSAKVTFEDIDGLEWIAAAGTSDGYVIIQEDGGNDFGERTFISKVETGGAKMQYHFIAQSGGDDNTRNKALVGVPAGTGVSASNHEFSGASDLSGMLAKNAQGSFKVHAGAAGAKRAAEAEVDINHKILAFGLQAHSLRGGVIEAFRGDRGGQIYAFQPHLS